MKATALPSSRFIIIKPLTAGGMASIFLAHHVEDPSKLVVIKKIISQYDNDPAFVKMFKREAEIGLQLEHPNLVRTHHVGHHDDDLFIVLEYIDGISLRELNKDLQNNGKSLSTAAYLYLFLSVAKGLNYLHSRVMGGLTSPIVHRDISPHNIMIGRNGEIKIIDFGVSKTLHADQNQTIAGTLKGKITYMSPEQAKGEPQLGPASDIFSLGLLALELATSERNFKNLETLQVLAKIREWSVEEVLSRTSRLDDSLKSWIVGALNPDSKVRLTAAQIVAIIESQLFAIDPNYNQTSFANEVCPNIAPSISPVMDARTVNLAKAPVMDLYSMLTEPEKKSKALWMEVTAVVVLVAGVSYWQRSKIQSYLAGSAQPNRSIAAIPPTKGPEKTKLYLGLGAHSSFHVEINRRALSLKEKQEGVMVDSNKPFELRVYHPKKKKWITKRVDLRDPNSNLRLEL